MEEELKSILKFIDDDFVKILMKIPPRKELYLPPYWLHIQIVERYKVLSYAGIKEGMNVLEIGCGAHAIATVPLAHMVGKCGRIVAVDIKRWTFFEEIIKSAGLQRRVIPIMCDATQLPFKYQCFNIGLIVHGIRSMRSEDNIVRIIKELLRVSSQIFLAESLPIAKNKAQEAHIEMYNLREEIFEALIGEKNDIHYFPLEKLVEMVKEAGGKIIDAKMIDVNLPHHLAFIPREYIEKIKDKMKQEGLLRRWENAYRKLQKYGEEHPPVGIIKAVKKN